MKKKILVIESREQKGHINLYRFQLSNLAKEYDVTFVTPAAYIANFANSSVRLVPLNSMFKKGESKIKRKLEDFVFLLSMVWKWKKRGFDRCLLLSFDTHVLGAISFFSDLQGLSMYVHNNIDESLRSKSHELFFRFISKKVKLIVFEDYIKRYLVQRGFQNVQVENHLLRVIGPTAKPKLSMQNSCGYIFHPSTNDSARFIQALLKFSRDNGLLIISKQARVAELSDNCVPLERYDDYDEVFAHAKYIATGLQYRYRVSGIVYEALANEKVVLASDCELIRQVAKSSPGSVKVIDRGSSGGNEN